jgi:3-oxoacyl-[acyl-carrier protein] reductase
MPQNTPFDLAGLTAVVTGAASGIGQAIALELATTGAHLVVHTRANRAGATQTAELAKARGVEAQVQLCNLAEPGELAPFVEAAWKWRGAVDIWVNNAGADVLTGDAARWPYERKLEALWAVDVRATMLLSQDVGWRMKTRGSGTIINMGWDRAETGMAGDSGEMFAATKGAVMAFTRSLACSLAPEVRVNCVAPGWIKTKWAEGASSKWHERAASESLVGRWGTPEDVASVVRFLASPAAKFVNAEIVKVGGGTKLF